MAWQERLNQAAYTPAGGERKTFDYEDVSHDSELRGSAFEFPDADGTLVQRTGNSSRRYPLQVIIWGDNYDLDADAFEAALRAPGVGVLEHPIYGTVSVVPFGPLKREDRLLSEGNQALINVTFWATVDTVYPISQVDPGAEVLASVGEFNAQAAAEFEQTTDLSGEVQKANFSTKYEAVLDFTTSRLQPIADQTDKVRDQFNAINESITQGIDILIDDPLTLASQTIVLTQTPARAKALIADQLSAYANMARDIIAQGVETPTFDAIASNSFHGRDLYVSTYVTGTVIAVVNADFQTRTDALGAAEFILELMDDVTLWRDLNYRALDEIDTGGQYQQLQEAVAIAAGFLVQISFTLKQERRVVITRNRTTIDLCAELYGSVDDRLDFFSDSNDLSWDEQLEICAGREIVYYI